jgi:hypothetical protein
MRSARAAHGEVESLQLRAERLQCLLPAVEAGGAILMVAMPSWVNLMSEM